MANTLGIGNIDLPRANQVDVRKVMVKEIGGKRITHIGHIFTDRIRLGHNFQIFGEKTTLTIVNIKRSIKNVENNTLLLQDAKDRKFIIRMVK